MPQAVFEPPIARDNYIDSNWRSNDPSHHGWLPFKSLWLRRRGNFFVHQLTWNLVDMLPTNSLTTCRRLINQILNVHNCKNALNCFPFKVRSHENEYNGSRFFFRKNVCHFVSQQGGQYQHLQENQIRSITWVVNPNWRAYL